MVIAYNPEEYLTITKGSTEVKVLLANREPIKFSADKQLITIAYPKQTPPLTYLVDIGRLLESVTVLGYLIDIGSVSAYTYKQRLRTINQTAGTMTIKWDKNDPGQWSGGSVDSGTWVGYTVNVSKYEVKEKKGSIYGATKPTVTGQTMNFDKYFDVQINFALGTHKG